MNTTAVVEKVEDAKYVQYANGKPTYVIDTNVIISNPKFMNDMEDSNVVIPIITLEELDKLKSKEGNTGFRCRQFFRMMKEFGALDGLNEGVDYINGITLSTTLSYDLDSIPDTLDKSYGDNKILALDIFKHTDARLVTSDISMAVKAGAMSIPVEVYAKSSQGKLKDMETGHCVASIPEFFIGDFRSDGYISYSAVMKFIPYEDVFPNKFFILQALGNEKNAVLARYDGKMNRLVALQFADNWYSGVQAKDAQQRFAVEALMHPDIPFVTMTAEPGCGKTFLSMAVGLDGVDNNVYEKLLIAKNTAPIDKWSYQGFTTGSTEEKLLTHFGNYGTTLENLDLDRGKFRAKDSSSGTTLLGGLIDAGAVEILDVSAILGSSFKNKFIIIDEAQSFDVHAMRSVITRIGEGCKLIIIGDLNQQTIAQLDPDKSGLFCAVEWLKCLHQTAHVTLKNVHRGTFVQEASEIFDSKMFG